MQEGDHVARRRKRFKRYAVSENDQPIPDNILDRRFEADGPNQRWVGDTTELTIGSGGRLFLAVILDLFSRIIVGWAISAINNRHLVIRALDMALLRRGPRAGLLHHTDQGSPYASEDYMKLLAARGVECSMSRRGNCYDNAAMEAFFSTLEFEVGTRFETAGDAKRELFDFIELFYNQKRRHSTVGNISPAAFERRARTTQVA
jgi:transposase InsO family protein